MYAVYQNKPDFEVYMKQAEHIPPHLHEPLEIAWLESGTMEVGVGKELYPMAAGDLAIIFPEVIHHYQILEGDAGNVLYIHAEPELCPAFRKMLQDYSTQSPVIPKDRITEDIRNAVASLARLDNQQIYSDILTESYLQVILARCLPLLHLVRKSSMGDRDLIYRTVEYIARHYTEPISLGSMAKDLYVSPYTLSRLFSSTFHMNFNRYLNQTRLRQFLHLLRMSNQSIIEAALDSGFESQRTLNRVFRDEFHMSPSQYKREVLKNRVVKNT